MSPVDRGEFLLNLIKQAVNQSVISFTAGFPEQKFFLVDEIKQAYIQVLMDPSNLQYSTDMRGLLSLREHIRQRLVKKKIEVTADEILLTTGSSQAIDLTSRLYLSAGDVVFVENPTYQEVLRLFSQLEAQIVPVKSDKDGINPDDLVDKIRKYKPKMVYVNPIYSNPVGKVWGLERKKLFLNICKKYNVLILEDDPYSDLPFSNQQLIPSLFSLDIDSTSSHVVYVSTFSKTIAPALRTGFAVARTSLLDPLVKMKSLSDLQSSTINQQVISHLLDSIDLDKHLVQMRNHYELKMNIMTNYLADQIGDEITWITPQGGIYLWVEIPQVIDSKKLLEQSLQEGVVYLPGEFFHVGIPKINAIRFNFTYPSQESIEEGMKRFVHAYRKIQRS